MLATHQSEHPEEANTVKSKRLEEDGSGTEDGGKTGTSASNGVRSTVGELRRRGGGSGGRAGAGAGDDGDAGVRARSAGAKRDRGG